MISWGTEAGVALESRLLALDLQRPRDRVRVTTVSDVAVGRDDPRLIDAAWVGGVEEGHELDHDSWRAMVLISIGVVAAADARVAGPGRVGWVRGILDVAGEGTGGPLGVVGCADVE